jgi:glycosyltransferase involved in cell wall biosynthesis
LVGDVEINSWEEHYEKTTGLARLKRGRQELHKAFSYPLYLLYLFIYSIFTIKKGDRVICMELDTFIPIFLGSFWKKTILYLDIVDPISQTKFRRVPCNKVFDYIEFFLLKFRTFNIIPNKNRLLFYNDRVGLDVSKCKYLLVENVPFLDGLSYSNDNDFKFDVGYFGTLDESRGLVELINYASISGLSLLIAGLGPLEEYISQKSIELGDSKINFYGSYSAGELDKLYSMVRYSWAYYTNETILHKYASPNKYYEHLAFKTPIIMNKFVPLSETIKAHNTGIIIDDYLNQYTFNNMIDDMKDFNIDDSDFGEWEFCYSNYFVDFSNYEKSLS